MMAEMKQDAHGELLLVENITTGKIDQKKVYLRQAQRMEGAFPEGGLLMHDSEFEAVLLHQFHALNVVEKRNVIAALLMFLSAQEENASDLLSIDEQNQ